MRIQVLDHESPRDVLKQYRLLLLPLVAYQNLKVRPYY